MLALCKLHNVCINQNKINIYSAHQVELLNVMKEGGMYRPRINGNGEAAWLYNINEDSGDLLDSILSGCNHQNDHTRADCRK